jgi:DNA polymerase III subunit alpha
MLKSINYINLHQHSSFSILDGIAKYQDYIDEIKKNSMEPYLAMTEHGYLGSSLNFLDTCKENDINPILGCEIYMTSNENMAEWKNGDIKAPVRSHLVLLAKNKKGYKELVKINNLAIKRGQTFVSRIQRWYVLITPDIIEEVKPKNLIALNACIGSFAFSPALFENNLKETKTRVDWLRKMFGEDYYFEFQTLDHPKQREMNKLQYEFMKRYKDQKAVITSDAHYVSEEDSYLRDITMAANWKVSLKQFKIINDKRNNTEEQIDIYFKTNEQMLNSYHENGHDKIIPEEVFEEACGNTIKIAESITKFSLKAKQELNTMKQYFEKDIDEQLKQECLKGFKKFYHTFDNPNLYADRLKNELSIIKNKNFTAYFLIVQRILQTLRERDIYHGPGRGSGGSFLINYLLEITTLDPIKNGFMQERFVDEARIDYPDLDIDIMDRKATVEIVKELFPQHDIVLISNKGLMHTKSLIKTVWRVLDIEYPAVGQNSLDSADAISKYIDNNYNLLTVTIYDLLKDKYFKQIMVDWHLNVGDDKGLNLESILKKLNGNLNFLSVHAGGLLILDKNDEIVPFIPLIGNDIANYASAYSESGSLTELESIGKIKFDFLGLANLRQLYEVINNISNDFDQDKRELYDKIHPSNINFQDQRVFEGFRNGHTEGIFQFNSPGMTNILKSLKVDSIDELSACNALYRPGPLGSKIHERLIHNKFNPNDIGKEFDKDIWKIIGPHLDNSAGQMIYEEQIMKIGRDIADYNPSQLNAFRKFLKSGQILKKKNKRKFNKLQKEFYDQFIMNGKEKNLNEESLISLWNIMEKFSNYSFNLSHSASYATLAFQTMFMSTYFPGYWYAAVLNQSFDKLENIIKEIQNRNLNIKILPPQLSNLYESCVFKMDEKDPNTGIIYIGLSRVKGIGEKAAAALSKLFDIKFRKFDTFIDYLIENKLSVINKRALLTMINIGMFDNFSLTRREARAKVLILKEKTNYRVVKEKKDGKRAKYRPMTIEEGIKKDNEDNNISDTFFYVSEIESLGIGFSENPAYKLKDKLTQIRFNPQIKNGKDYDAGLISMIKEKTTKKGKKYYYIQIDSLSQGNISAFVWEQDIKRIGFELLNDLKKFDTIVFIAKENDWGTGLTYNLKSLILIKED